jgi:hypothetical protein
MPVYREYFTDFGDLVELPLDQAVEGEVQK